MIFLRLLWVGLQTGGSTLIRSGPTLIWSGPTNLARVTFVGQANPGHIFWANVVFGLRSKSVRI